MESKSNLKPPVLLTDGAEAFPDILSSIDKATRSIEINMFIWRDDNIGNKIADALLLAAERGVKVNIRVDRYGVVLEKAEECRRSFFHKKQSITEKIKTAALGIFYPMEGAPKRAKDIESKLYSALKSHPNIALSVDEFRADHSKYYIFDDELLILGGINIEDKENGSDMQGRVYQDYMVRLEGAGYVSALRACMKGERAAVGGISFCINTKDISPHVFDLKKHYLQLIESAEKWLHITMAYFSPIPEFERAILDACRRGVEVSVLIPERANFQNDTNRRTVLRLLSRSKGRIRVFMSPKMVHTKLVATEKTVSMGSANITKKAFSQLSELNLVVENAGCDFTHRLFKDVEENIRLSKSITEPSEIKYSRAISIIEGLLV